MKKLFVLLFIMFILILAGCSLADTARQSAPLTDPAKDTGALVGNDRDEHNCIASAGYNWCAAKQKCLRVFEEFCADTTDKLVQDIKTESGVELKKGENTNFNWLVATSETMTDATVSGIKYEAAKVKFTDYEKIENYLNKAWRPDPTNIADGVTGGLRGFQGDYAVCALTFTRPEMSASPEGPLVPANDLVDVKLECGYYNDNDTPKLITAQIVKEILAAKYKKAVGELKVTVSRMDDTHAAGGVKFGPEGTPGGLFLAVKTEGKWQVVYDGNGSIDCALMKDKYQFSAELLTGFCD
jgi:hypothetical protein